MSKKITTKQKTKIIRPEHLWLLIILFTYLITGVLLAKTWYKYQINPDATSYFSIAEKYAHGNLKEGVNGYWGPLLSWLLIPFVWLGKNLIVGAKLISLASGAVLLITAYFLMLRELKIDKKLSTISTLALSFMLLGFNYPGAITPDILFISVLVLEVYALIVFLKKPTLKNIFLLGLCGGLLYFAKFYGGYFFISQIGLIAALSLIKSKKITVLIPFIKVGLVFGLFILPFVLAISFKYNRATLSTAGPYNQGIIKLDSGKILTPHPMTINGPFAPPNKSAYSVWEDPTSLNVPTYKPLKYKNDFIRLLQIMWLNIIATRTHIVEMGFITIVGLLLLTTKMLYLGKKLYKNYSDPLVVLFITSLALAGGYILVLTEQRYLWGLAIIGLITFATYFSNDVKNIRFSRLFLLLATILIGWVNLDIIINNKYVNKTDYSTGQFVGSVIPKGENIVSDTFSSIHTCYFAKLHCFGIVTPSASPKEQENIRQILLTNKVNYLVDYHTKDGDKAFTEFKDRFFITLRAEKDQPTILKLR